MPPGVANGLGALLIAAGALLAVVAIRSRRGSLPRNWIVGIRSTSTLASDAAWVAAHRAAAPSLAFGSVGSVVAGIALAFRPSNRVGLAIVLVGLVWLLTFVVAGGYLGNRAARDAD